ncbi:MAG: TIR domain-containing protein [Woeseia sp.]
MSEDNPIRVFVAHNFAEDDDYLRVFEFLASLERFFYVNCSKPENMPAAGGLEAIKAELTSQIVESEAVIIPASTFSEHSDLVRFQMDTAEAHGKPLIAIRPFGGIAETPDELVGRVNEHINWNEREIAHALRRQARLQDTSRWDVIDFP